MSLSGWCATTAPGHARDHATCAERIAAGLLDGCGCQDHGGHETATNDGEDAA